MPEFSIKPEVMNAQANMKQLAKSMIKASFSVDDVLNNLGYKISSSAAIRARLEVLSQDMCEHSKGLDHMGDALKDAMDRYKVAEQRAYSNAGGKGSAIGAAWSRYVSGGEADEKSTSDVKKGDKKDGDFKWSDLGHVVLKGFGPIGGLISTVGKFVTGDKGKTATWGSFVSGLMKGGEKITKLIKTSDKKVSAKWAEAFGFDIKKFDKKPFAQHWDDQIGKVTPISAAASFVSSAFENYDEFKDSKDWERMAKETVVETVVDIGKGALIGAGVAAAAAAAGVALPAVAVGVVTAGVAWGADYLCKKFTGKKVNDAVGDLIIDTAEKISSAKKKVKKAVANKLKAAWSMLSFA